MDTMIQKAAKGNRTALTQLYEHNKQAVYFLCRALLQNSPSALPAAKWALKAAFQAVERGDVQTEEAFFACAAEKVAAYCRKDVVKRDSMAFRLPPQRNCRITPAAESRIDPAAAPADNYIQCLPAAQRFALVLRLAAGMSDEQAAKTMGVSPAHLALLREAEPENLSRIYRSLQAQNVACIAPTPELLAITFEDAVIHTQIPEELDQHLYGYINTCAAPEKHAPGRWAACVAAAAVVILALLLIAVFSSGEDTDSSDQDAAITTGGTADGEAAPADDTANSVDDEAASGLDAALTYYADIMIQDYGTITVQLDQAAAPITAANFVALAESGFYDGLTFHRIIDGFMMQGGDPNGDGTGGAEETIPGEFTSNGYDNPLSHTRGAVSMARSSDCDSASSQFFIVHQDSTYLDGDYAVFGYVTAGMEVVDSICESAQPTDSNGSIAADAQPVITSVTIRTESAA